MSQNHVAQGRGGESAWRLFGRARGCARARHIGRESPAAGTAWRRVLRRLDAGFLALIKLALLAMAVWLGTATVRHVTGALEALARPAPTTVSPRK